MRLRTKNIVAIAPTLLLAIGLLYGASRYIVHHGFAEVEQDLLRSFAKIEEEETKQDVRRARDALQAEIENLSVKASDWAQWDDTYRFVVDGNEAYRRSNLKDAALSDLKLNLIAIIGPGDKPAFERWYDLERGQAAPLPEGLISELRPGKPLLAHRNVEDVHSGILLLPEGPLMIVSRPITTSEGKGELRGSVVFGRLLNEAGFHRLASLTHLSMRWERAHGTVPAGFPPRGGSTGGEEIGVVAGGSDVMTGYALVRDLVGNPAFFLHVRIPREIYRQGLITAQLIQGRGRVVLLSLVMAILVAGLALGGVVLLVLERSVLRRLSRLSRKAGRMGTSRGAWRPQERTKSRTWPAPSTRCSRTSPRPTVPFRKAGRT